MSSLQGYNDNDYDVEVKSDEKGRISLNDTKKKKRFMAMGASSVMMIFIVLCLTTFAILSFVTAKADMRMTLKAQDSVVNYYAAAAKTDEIIMNIDMVLADAGLTLEDKLRSVMGIENAQIVDDKIVVIVAVDDIRYIKTEISVAAFDTKQLVILSRRVIADIEFKNGIEYSPPDSLLEEDLIEIDIY